MHDVFVKLVCVHRNGLHKESVRRYDKHVCVLITCNVILEDHLPGTQFFLSLAEIDGFRCHPDCQGRIFLPEGLDECPVAAAQIVQQKIQCLDELRVLSALRFVLLPGKKILCLVKSRPHQALSVKMGLTLEIPERFVKGIEPLPPLQALSLFTAGQGPFLVARFRVLPVELQKQVDQGLIDLGFAAQEALPVLTSLQPAGHALNTGHGLLIILQGFLIVSFCFL